MSDTNETQIANDLDKIDLILAIGSENAKRMARKHRKACFAEIDRKNFKSGLSDISDADLLVALES